MENTSIFSEHELFHNGSGVDTNAAIAAGSQLVNTLGGLAATHAANKSAGISKGDIKAHCGNDPFIRLSKKQKQKHQDFLKCKADYLDKMRGQGGNNTGGGGGNTGGGNNDTPPPKSHTMTYVLIGVGAIGLIVGGIFIFKHIGKASVAAPII